MKEKHENGPPRPRSEMEKVGEALYDVLKKQFPTIDNWSHSFTIIKNPREVKIHFKPLLEIDESSKQGEDFIEVVEEILGGYDLDPNIIVTYEDRGQVGYSIFIKDIN